MTSELLLELELEFGGGFRHIDIRFGIMGYGSWIVIPKKKSFQMLMNWKMPTTTKSVIERGSKTWVKVRKMPAPSIRAASNNSSGSGQEGWDGFRQGRGREKPKPSPKPPSAQSNGVT